jgi:hypothetical protein
MTSKEHLHLIINMETATEIKLFGKWSLDDVEIADIALVVSFV